MTKQTCKRLAAVLLTLAALPAALAAEDSRVEFARDDAKGQMQILVDGKEALVYQCGKDLDMAHFYPVRSPGDTASVPRCLATISAVLAPSNTGWPVNNQYATHPSE